MLIEIINYSKRPRIKSLQKISFVEFMTFAVKSILLIVILNAPSSSIIKLLGLKHKLGDFPPELIFVPILIAPIYEEVIFRILLKVTKLNVVIFFVTILALTSYCLYMQNYSWVIFLVTITLIWSIYIFLNKLSLNMYFIFRLAYLH